MSDVRVLPPEAIDIIRQIDRAEHVTVGYQVVDGRLRSGPVDWEVPGWFQDGEGPHTISSYIADLRPILEGGGVLLAFLDGETARGLAVVVPGFEPGTTWLAFLHVSRLHRRTGVASALWAESVRLARAAGDQEIYVSATPSASAVGFYLSRGCELARPPHPGLFAKEPEDIHLVCSLARDDDRIRPLPDMNHS